jgi:CheY-like chemotaxis protein
MDCQLPIMDGFQATQRIREAEIGQHRTPIIALTAGAMKEERDHCYEAGMDDFLLQTNAAQRLLRGQSQQCRQTLPRDRIGPPRHQACSMLHGSFSC